MHCSQYCGGADKVFHPKIYRVEEVIVNGDSDQVVVTTSADLFEVKKALCKDRSAQLLGSMTAQALQHLAEKRYTSRFSTSAVDSAEAVTSSSSTSSTPLRRCLLSYDYGR